MMVSVFVRPIWHELRPQHLDVSQEEQNRDHKFLQTADIDRIAIRNLFSKVKVRPTCLGRADVAVDETLLCRSTDCGI
jgi:hypothetical protein